MVGLKCLLRQATPKTKNNSFSRTQAAFEFLIIQAGSLGLKETGLGTSSANIEKTLDIRTMRLCDAVAKQREVKLLRRPRLTCCDDNYIYPFAPRRQFHRYLS